MPVTGPSVIFYFFFFIVVKMKWYDVFLGYRNDVKIDKQPTSSWDFVYLDKEYYYDQYK